MNLKTDRQSEMFKEVNTIDMILLNVNFKIVFLFSVTYVEGTHWNCIYELPHRSNSNIYLQHMPFQN